MSNGTRTSADAMPSSSSGSSGGGSGGVDGPGPAGASRAGRTISRPSRMRVDLVGGEVVGQARRCGVHLGAAELLLVGVLVDRHLHQRRSAEVDAGRVLHEHV